MAPVSNSPRVFPISCREIHLACPPRHIIHLSPLPLLPSFAPPVANSFQSSFMPPGGEDLITRGEWIPPPSLASDPLSLHRSRHRHRLPLHFSPFLLLFFSSFSPFSKLAVSRKPAARSLGFRGPSSLPGSRRGF